MRGRSAGERSIGTIGVAAPNRDRRVPPSYRHTTAHLVRRLGDRLLAAGTLRCRLAFSLDHAGLNPEVLTAGTPDRLQSEIYAAIGEGETVLPCAEFAMLYWALPASGQITMRKVDGWQSVAEKPNDKIIDLAA
jgi:hypothetical protein